jgi:hypothetical protein
MKFCFGPTFAGTQGQIPRAPTTYIVERTVDRNESELWPPRKYAVNVRGVTVQLIADSAPGTERNGVQAEVLGTEELNWAAYQFEATADLSPICYSDYLQ